MKEVLSIPDSNQTPYGLFVENDVVIEDMQYLHLDVQSIQNLEQDVRKFYLEDLIVRYKQLADLTAQLQSLVSLSTRPALTIDMYESMNWINSQVAELLDCSSVRVLLLDEHATFLWCITVDTYLCELCSAPFDAFSPSIMTLADA